jgi:hypothetical protein
VSARSTTVAKRRVGRCHHRTQGCSLRRSDVAKNTRHEPNGDVLQHSTTRCVGTLLSADRKDFRRRQEAECTQEKKWGSLVSHARIVQDNAIGSELGRFNPLQHSRPIQPIRHGWRSIFGSIRETMVGIELRSRHSGELSRAYPIVSTVDAVYDVSLSANLRHRSHSEHHEALHSTRT